MKKYIFTVILVGAALFVGRATTEQNYSFVLMFTLQLNILTGTFSQLFQHISKSIVVSARSWPKLLTKTYNKEVGQAS